MKTERRLEFKTSEIEKMATAEQKRGVNETPRPKEDLDWNLTESIADLIIKDLGYQPFDPSRELKDLRKFTPEEEKLPTKERWRIRKQRRLEFREQLENQKKGVAEVIEGLLAAIKENPDLGREGLLKIVEGQATTYRFSSEQIALFLTAFDEFERKHKAVSEAYQRYNPKALFKACFGREPKGRVEVIEGPMTLTLRCFDADDYIWANTFYLHGGDENKFRAPELREIKNSKLLSGGAALPTVNRQELADTINIENAANNMEIAEDGLSRIKNVKWSEQIMAHEEQHQINKLFKPLEHRLESLGIINEVISKKPSVESAVGEIIRRLVRLKRQELVDWLARDEILACYRDGRFTTKEIEKILRDSELYNYKKMFEREFDVLPDNIVKQLKDNLYAIVPDELTVEEPGGAEIPAGRIVDVEKIKLKEGLFAQAVIGIEAVFDEFKKEDLPRWLGVIDALEKKNYSREEIFGLLYQTPVNRWAKLANRTKPKHHFLVKDLIVK